MIEKTYEKDDLIIYWRPEMCEHAGECVKGSPKVFDVKRRPWIDPSQDTTEHIMEVIDRCPSRALSYKRK
ncbi:(4Fe-4S)-binding protein [Streptococcus zalophi]|uniref:(4Fe-4S)-binding protein n=1 Tax=Streptococcus zalophi TaxID=640031 RepID=A0A934P8U7_9STRE|nr:(4Fe-4S)-binding protein [Streptococcus zalophi]MBJ8349092.1 (4Fe-4S)-binding protein [Streptococcus zalophi]MCR8967757.1 (4Fe-4S)-binding protein [Streptococcus zalophi]